MVKHKKTGRKLANKGGNFLKASTKKINKLVKRGKLKKSVGKKTLLKVLKEKTSKKTDPEVKPIVEEKDIPLHEADYEYFAKPGRNFDFLFSVPELEEGKNGRKKRKKADDECLEKNYEKKLKLNSSHDVDVLPIKIKDKNIYLPKEEKPSDEDEKEVKDEPNIESTQEKADPEDAPFIEKYLKKEIEVRDMKKLISQLSAEVIQRGTENIEKLAQIIPYLGKGYPYLIKKWAMANLFQVFKDIIPDYRIRPLTDTEREQKMKKETKELITYEDCLLTQYHKFLDILVNFSRGHVGSEKNDDEEKEMKQKRVLKRKSIEYLGELLACHPHFNFRTNIIGALVAAMCNHDTKTSDIACDAVKTVFTRDKSYEVILEIVRLIGRTIKAKPKKIKSKVLDTFLSLKIREVEKEDAPLTAAEMRKRNEAMSRKERKRKKQMKYLEKELQQAAAEDNKKQKGKLRTEIISVIFLIYFRILKMDEMSSLLSSVLEGLAKFAHLINISYFNDLFAALTKLSESEELSNRESLFCIQTALTLLIDQGSAFNIDPSKFYVNLYKTLDKIDFTNYESDLPVALKCLDLMINKRKKQVSDQRCMAFIKRMSICLLKLPPSGALPLLAMIRNIMQNHPKCDLLLETDGIGSGSFLSEVDNPDHCNAQSSSLYELHLLRSHYDPNIVQYAEHLIHGMPREGPRKLSLSLSRISSTELFNEQKEQINMKNTAKSFDKTKAKSFPKESQNPRKE